jgi:hypothetical protein
MIEVDDAVEVLVRRCVVEGGEETETYIVESL